MPVPFLSSDIQKGEYSERLKQKILEIGESFFAQKIRTDILNYMVFQIYLTNQTSKTKNAFLKQLLTYCGEVPQSYYVVRLEKEAYELHIDENGVRFSLLNATEEMLPGIQFDWDEFGDLTAHLVEAECIYYSEDLETIKKQQKMFHMYPWFVSLQKEYAAIMEKEELEFTSEELREIADNGGFETPQSPYHDHIRRGTALAFIETSMAVVPYQALIYDFFRRDTSQRTKEEFLQCLLTEVNGYKDLALPVEGAPVRVWIEDNLVRIGYPDTEGNWYEQYLSYEEIAEEIQEAIDSQSFLTPEEYELGRMEGYAFCGQAAIELFQEFSEKICEEPPKRTEESGMMPGEGRLEGSPQETEPPKRTEELDMMSEEAEEPSQKTEEKTDAGKTAETEEKPDLEKEAKSIGAEDAISKEEEWSGEAQDFYFPPDWKLPEGGSKKIGRAHV